MLRNLNRTLSEFTRAGLLMAGLGGIAFQSFSAPDEDFAGDVRPTLEKYCFKCHGATKPKAGVNLEQVTNVAGIYRDLKSWEAVARQLKERNMPPEGKLQPSLDDRDKLVHWLETRLNNPDLALIPRDPGRVLIHRLSRMEYNFTVQDMFGITNRPADKFPSDGGGGGGFDNNADTLFVPPILMEKYLAAAREILAAAPRERIFFSKPGVLTSERANAKRIIEHFALRGFRRPPAAEEVDRLLSLHDKSRRAGATPEQSVKEALAAILVSPKFLFRIEEDRPSKGAYRLDDYALATRLSYFLWSSLPDDELLQVAAKGELNRPEILEKQTRRMLASPKGRRFTENFSGQWLKAKDLKTAAQPDTGVFGAYTPALRDAMYGEVVQFFDHLVTEDRSVLDLLDSDYTYANEELARLYGIEGVTGDEFRKVSFKDRHRGGVLGMAAVLTLTSYPRRTSPVLRGKWVLEELLGTPPPPPPAMVKSLPQDDRPREGLTFRQQLEAHRNKPECAACHRRMDPLGFGLENFDGIGRWRDKIADKPVDASGLLAEGQKFEGPQELRRILMEKKREDFVRNLTERMLSYALGRGLEYYDIRAVKEIMAELTGRDYRAGALVMAVAKSFPFQYRRNEPVLLTQP